MEILEKLRLSKKKLLVLVPLVERTFLNFCKIKKVH